MYFGADLSAPQSAPSLSRFADVSGESGSACGHAFRCRFVCSVVCAFGVDVARELRSGVQVTEGVRQLRACSSEVAWVAP